MTASRGIPTKKSLLLTSCLVPQRFGVLQVHSIASQRSHKSLVEVKSYTLILLLQLQSCLVECKLLWDSCQEGERMGSYEMRSVDCRQDGVIRRR